MGYESKVIVINRDEIPNLWAVGQELARFDLSCMGYETYNGKMFPELFTTPVDFNLYVRTTDEVVDEEFYRKDNYGEHCKYTANLDEVISWLEEAEKKEHYRRARMLLNFLKAFKDQIDEYDEIVLVHYGY